MTLQASHQYDNHGEQLATPDGCFAETVTEIEHYTDGLFRFRMTRPASFRFRSGEFVMIGLPGESLFIAPIPSPRRTGMTRWNSILSRCRVAR